MNDIMPSTAYGKRLLRLRGAFGLPTAGTLPTTVLFFYFSIYDNGMPPCHVISSPWHIANLIYDSSYFFSVFVQNEENSFLDKYLFDVAT